ncbi:MAG: hypothetical protein M1834_007556 [Cirrosporium novae-zelandiae]|nr:MAG: hypothetical protein M1834_007556 [Cirrosporium novae-zelandiae]
MPSLHKAASVALRPEQAHPDGEAVHQAGRSSTNIAAHAAAAALRNSTGRVPSKITYCELARRASMTAVGHAHNTSEIASGSLRPERASWTPNTPSPPTNSAAVSITGSDSEEPAERTRESTSTESSDPSHSRSDPSTSKSSELTTSPAPPISRGRQLWQRLDERDESSSAGSQSRSSLIGVGYSRYPNSNCVSSITIESSGMSNSNRVSAMPLLPSNPFRSGTSTPRLIPEQTLTPFIDERYAPADYNFPLFMSEKEADDDMHNPGPDDDVKYRPRARDYCAREQLCSLIGSMFLILGLLFLFVLFPILTYSNILTYDYPDDDPLSDFSNTVDCATDWYCVNNKTYPLLSNIRTGLIDPDTPESAKTKTGVDGDTLKLVFSDEFNKNNRTFYPGDDPYWTAPDFWYGSTQDLEWYDPDAATTYDGTLIFQLDKFANHDLSYRSGMLNSWNQVCMKGGSLEVSLSLPGPGGVPGLWPGVWTMGNLGRPGYRASTEGLWPYTYNSCDAGITPNQSQSDGLSHLPGQKLPSCTCDGEDHPSPGTGRGAPEIDVIEAGADVNSRIGLVTQSYQVAPYDIWWHPNYDYLALRDLEITQINGYTGGPFQQAISGTTMLNNDWYDGVEYQKYSFEYTPGTGGSSGIAWFVGDDMSYRMNGNAIGPNGNVQARIISEEPMSIVLNLGFSASWTEIDYDDLVFPTMMRIDYVRWYQKEGEEMVTCDPPGYETTEYIKNHPKAYENYNLTVS